MVLAVGASTLVERLATDPEIKGSYPATAWHKEEMAGKFLCPKNVGLLKNRKRVPYNLFAAVG